NPLQLLVPPEYGYLTDLKKLRDGITIGVKEIKFVRPSAFIDPMTNIEWEPVRARDPRIMKFLQAYAAETGIVIPQQYLLIAGPPQRLHLAKPVTTDPNAPPGAPGVVTDPQQGQTQQPGQPGLQPVPRPTSPPGQPGARPRVQPANGDDDDDDDDDNDENIADPLAHSFENYTPGHSNGPIVGVAPKLKGKAIKPLYGLEKYEEWVFMYMPRLNQPNPGIRQIPAFQNNPQRPNPGGGTGGAVTRPLN